MADKNAVLNIIYDSYKETEDATFNDEILPKIQQVDYKHPDFFSDSQKEVNEELNQKWADARKNYKKGFNHFGYWMLAIFGLFFSIILIIPAYWAFKKFKQMKAKKAHLNKLVDEAVQNKLEFLDETVSQLDLTEYFRDMYKITKFEPCGPLHDAVVEYAKQNSMFNLVNNSDQNTLATSWGIFENNKIVINVQNAQHYMTQKEYIGSTTIKSGDNYVTVYASVWKPKPVFDYSSKHWFFMSSCSNLEMELLKTYPSGNRSLLMNKQALLENKEFEKSFKWEYNDPVQVRMIFTPYTQEFYVHNAFYKKEFRDNYELKKVKSFITNNNSFSQKSLSLTVVDAMNNPTTDLDFLDTLIRKVAIDKVHTSYLNLTPGWNLPILKSEDHSEALLRIKQANKIPDLSTFHYILNKVFKYEVVESDTDTFHNIGNHFEFFSSFGNKIYGVQMDGVSYEIHRRVEHVSTLYGLSYVSVPVEYDDYVPVYGSKNIFMTYINNKWSHSNFFTLINMNKNSDLSRELSPIISKYQERGIQILIEGSILTVMCDTIPQEEVVGIFDEIIPVLKKYN